MNDAGFRNVYEDALRASAYARLGFPGTYALAFRDLPDLLSRHVHGHRSLDFGCGTGRSTRWLRDHRFECVGVDISRAMLQKARELDPKGDYRLVPEEDLSTLGEGGFDLVLSAFTFDNIPTRERKERALAALTRVLAPRGRLVSIVSSPDIYRNEWTSFSTRDFPENRLAQSGDEVRIVMLDVPDSRPVVDVLFTDEDYRDLYARNGLVVLEELRPLGRNGEGIAWKSETKIAPWVIWALGLEKND